MLIGVPKEIKNNESRVGLTAAGVAAFVGAGHKVFVEKNAGIGSGFSDADYVGAGAEILPDAKAVYSTAEMIIKVKEPIAPEYPLIKERQIIYTYLHLAPEPELTKVLMDQNAVAIAYETVQMPNGSLPLLTPMSEVAGRMSIQVAANYITGPHGGKGILLGGVPGVAPAKVVIVGGGVVGTNAAKMAIGLGADVTIFEANIDRMRYLDDIFGNKIKTVYSTEFDLAKAIETADVVVGAVLIPGARAPRLVKEYMVKAMRPGSVIVDVAIDQGGSVETIDRVTTHADPTFVKHGVVHYSVGNMPGAVARTSTFALTNATLPYGLAIANKGWKKAIMDSEPLKKGVNVLEGKVTYKAVAEALNLEYTPVDSLL